MKSFKCFYSVLLFAVALNFVCSESPMQSQPPQPEPGPPSLPNFSLINFTFPANAPDVVSMRNGEALGDLAFALQMFDLAKGKTPAGKHPDWEWKTDLTPYQVTIQAHRLNGEAVAWQLRMDGGPQQGGGLILINWLAAEGTIQSEGSIGSFKMYITNTTILSAETSWSRAGDGALRIESEKSQQQFSYTIDPDNSGGFLITDANGMKTFEANWDSSGAGSWIVYDPATGLQVDSGSWTA